MEDQRTQLEIAMDTLDKIKFPDPLNSFQRGYNVAIEDCIDELIRINNQIK
jgi:hypothetical protein